MKKIIALVAWSIVSIGNPIGAGEDKALVHAKLAIADQAVVSLLADVSDSEVETAKLIRRIYAVRHHLVRHGLDQPDLRATLRQLEALSRISSFEGTWSFEGSEGSSLFKGETSIAGIVREDGTNDPLESIAVDLYDSDGFFFASVFTDELGEYLFEFLPSGSYFVAAGRESAFLAELYDDVQCAQYCQPIADYPSAVAVESGNSAVDFALSRGAVIAGKVTDGLGEPIASDALVVAWSTESLLQVGHDFSDSNGDYHITGLAEGDYYVTADSFFDHQDELYQDIPCPSSACDLTIGTTVPASLGMTTSGIDFSLDRLGTMIGVVTDAISGGPIPLVELEVADDSAAYVTSGFTDDLGQFTIGGLQPGTYFVVADSYLGHQDELFDDLPCPGTSCDLVGGTPVVVDLNQVTPGIDFSLERLATIDGRVTSAASGDPIFGATIEIREPTFGTMVASADSALDGRYTVEGLEPGSYFAIASENAYEFELFEEVLCPMGVCDRDQASTLTVDLNAELSGVDFTLDRLGEISGTLTDAVSGDPIPDASIEVYDLVAEGVFLYGSTDAAGRFEVNGLPPGTYFVRTAVGFGYEDQLYEEITCLEGNCDPRTGAPLAVDYESVLSDIDFSLTPVFPMPCFPSESALCLNNGRFRVKSQWTDFVGQSGPGQAYQLTDDTGYFWFFNQDNIELVVKVLDACDLPGFNSFWVFAGGLTDVGVELQVTDTQTGEIRVYRNELGVPYQPVQDVGAFDTCGAGASARLGGELSTLVQGFEAEDLGSSRQLGPKDHLACLEDGSNLCLNGSRFEAVVEWQTSSGQSGSGEAVRLTEDSGYFWFFGSDNVEIVMKVLDACTLPGFENYWVFAAGLTDVAVNLRVRDTVTDQVREYLSPLGQRFQPVTDTEAFDSCP